METKRTANDIFQQTKDGVTDGYCINCSCGMRNGRHQDFRRGLHNNLCDCKTAEVVLNCSKKDLYDYDRGVAR